MSAREDVARARKLVELAAHDTTPPEEARTAAVAACRLIAQLQRDYGLVFTNKSHLPSEAAATIREIIELILRVVDEQRPDMRADYEAILNDYLGPTEVMQ